MKAPHLICSCNVEEACVVTFWRDAGELRIVIRHNDGCRLVLTVDQAALLAETLLGNVGATSLHGGAPVRANPRAVADDAHRDEVQLVAQLARATC